MGYYSQGTIIQYIRSAKYPSIRCCGIVITARCDIANKKTTHIHVLSAMSVKDFIFEVLFDSVITRKRNDLNNRIKRFSEANGFSYEVITEKGWERTIHILKEINCDNQNKLAKKRKKEIEGLITEVEAFYKIECCQNREDKEGQFESVRGMILEDIKRLHNSNLANYCFLPKVSYDEKESLTEGIVVDLKDIYAIDCSIVDAIEAGKLDTRTLCQTDLVKYNDMFFLENDEYVNSIGIVKSPWIEHMVQAFAYSFARVGVDNASSDEVDEFFDRYLE